MGYPRYEEIMDERKRRRVQEVEGGRQRVLRDMAQGLVDRMTLDYNLSSVNLDTSDPDPRKWVVTMEVTTDVFLEENFWEFPSEEFITKKMLLGG